VALGARHLPSLPCSARRHRRRRRRLRVVVAQGLMI
jgi:hypothetical protein